ncbi:cysteine dioxygenase [Bombyx mandarina]|uniref:Cysteine dioxygenase n=1 Tax=Bombyx mandarina TaxID=7092 RepID=A0A6J2KQ57_BOMMA|nr:cysteine dioxygenase [Bombyx mandarina]
MDVENANCKLKVSQCTDMEILPIEKPLKVNHEIAGLERLIEELHGIFSRSHVNVQDVQKLMAGYKSDPKDWRKYAKFDRFRYTRNLVDVGNGAFNIMILCWGPGHASAIHDHADSHCFMKLLSGSLEEIRYDWPDDVQPEVLRTIKENANTGDQNCDNHTAMSTDYNDSCQRQNDSCQGDSHMNSGEEDEDYYDLKDMKEIGRTRLEVNDVCYINDALGLHRMENPSHVDGAVSLHLYCPPFDSCRVFDARTGRPTQVKVTFWSMYGKKIKRVIEANDAVDSQ